MGRVCIQAVEASTPSRGTGRTGRVGDCLDAGYLWALEIRWADDCR